MSAGIRARLCAIVAVVVVSLWAVIPPRERITLGLDLAGGAQLVLQVRTDQALRAHTQSAADRLRVTLSGPTASDAVITVTGPTEFTASRVGHEATFRSAAATVTNAFDRTSADGVYTFRMTPAAADALARDTVDQALRTIERRVNALGVSEASVARYTQRDQILVELPGVTDVDAAKAILTSTAQLRLTLVDRGPFPGIDAARQAYGSAVPDTIELLPGADHANAGAVVYYAVDRTAAVTGGDLRDVRQSADDLNRPAVHFTLKDEAGARFGAFTAQHVGRTLATVLDGRVTSVATIESRIDTSGQIAGLSHAEMLEQVITFKSGALPADLRYVAERTIGASLGDDAIRSGVLASAGGLGLVVLFMLGYYRLAGINAAVSIVLNLLILLALAALIPVTMTLPGIAGLILTIGMGVDSNVLVFERIREELGRAAGARSAVRAGFDRVWLTIVDTHVTSLIAAAFLFQFGTSAIQGFATTLTIGLVANVFTAVFASRTIFELAVRQDRGITTAMSLTAPTSRDARPFDFIRWGVPALLLSAAVVAGGVAAVATRGVPLGIDFAGGTLVVAEFEAPGASEDAVRAAVTPLPGDVVVQRYGAAADRRFLVRVPLDHTSTGATPTLDTTVRQVTAALDAASLPPFTIVDRELVSASVGDDLQRRGLYATVASLAAITAYIGLRFRFWFAAGAIAATCHDVAITLACLAMAGYDLSLNVTAALLTVIGYSVNDTIVIFDRVRENARTLRSATLADAVNISVQHTLGRTVITAGTTLLSVLSLYLFGGDALRGFAFTMLVGIVSGTWSTVFIASALAARLGKASAAAAPDRALHRRV
ncbi:MAG TPA: protein translocase subunit SecD [Luteitalea sp.]|nr:protein translocase subunit SecD [Luteitalea sp.]